MRRTGRKITLGLIVIVLGAGVLLKVIPPETDVALNDQHLVSIDGTLVTNPLDLSEVTRQSPVFPLAPIMLPSEPVAEQGAQRNDWFPDLPGQTTTAFFPPLASPTNNQKTNGNSPSNPPPAGTSDEQTPKGGNDGNGDFLPPVIAKDSGDGSSGSSGSGGSGGTGSPGNGGNTGSGSGGGTGAVSDPVIPPSGSADGNPDEPGKSNGPFIPLPTVPPVVLGSDEGSIPSGELPLPFPDPISDQPGQTVPESPTHSVPDSGGTFALLVVASVMMLPLRQITSSRKSKSTGE